MNEVSTKLIVDLVRFLELRGSDQSDLFDGKNDSDFEGLDQGRVLRPRGSISWQVFSKILDRLPGVISFEKHCTLDGRRCYFS